MTSLQRLSILAAAALLAIGAVSVVMAQTPGTGRGASPIRRENRDDDQGIATVVKRWFMVSVPMSA